MGLVDGDDVGGVHAPDLEGWLDPFVPRPRSDEFIVRDRVDARGVDRHHVVRAVEGRTHGEPTRLRTTFAEHVTAVPDDLVTNLAGSTLVADEMVFS